ncbi:MAG: sugar phosphate isomerase/epimerase [Chlorobi bacterium]|nr:sugar phosphate isomerase/epimerase [Chlorobiota bacterium]
MDIELSGGTFEPDIIEKLKPYKEIINFRLHNYFPPPEIPFVFNLASLDDYVAKTSIAHVKNSIRSSVILNSTVFAFHAGFLLDPKPEELGKRIKSREIFNKSDSMKYFIDRVNELAIFSEKEGVNLLIENNVISIGNFNEFNKDVLLMTNPEDCKYVMEHTPDTVNMLLDVAHLKVSAQTLDFDRGNMFRECWKWIKGYHLSDNDGTSDSNNCISTDSWFWEHLNKECNYITIEIYNEQLNTIKQQLEIVKQQISKCQ